MSHLSALSRLRPGDKWRWLNMFLQDHRENGKLQPDHPGDSPALGPPGGVESLYSQPALPLQLHQCGHHPAGEECPAAANTAPGLTWRADHYHCLHYLVCVQNELSTLCCTCLTDSTHPHMYKASLTYNKTGSVVHASSSRSALFSISLISLLCFWLYLSSIHISVELSLS